MEYVEPEPIKTIEKKPCALCGKDAALALFGVGLGVLFILMGLDTLRRMRLQSTVDGEVIDDE